MDTHYFYIKEDHHRNGWTYKRGTMFRPCPTGNHIWKQQNSRIRRAAVRSNCAHQDYESTLNRNRMLDVYSSSHDNDKTERYNPVRSKSVSYFSGQRNVMERCAIRSFKHGVRKMPTEYSDQKTPQEEWVCSYQARRNASSQYRYYTKLLSQETELDGFNVTVENIQYLFD
jgi:hypothetical protein